MNSHRMLRLVVTWCLWLALVPLFIESALLALAGFAYGVRGAEESLILIIIFACSVGCFFIVQHTTRWGVRLVSLAAYVPVFFFVAGLWGFYFLMWWFDNWI